MKKLLLSMAVVAMLFSCSKDSVETETTADLTQMTPSKSLDDKTDGMYVGVFGHHEIKALHGKIFINVNNDGNYTAKIEMVNGDHIKFVGSSINNTNIHFTSDRGSFDYDTLNFATPVASNVFIDNEESYIVTVKAKNNLVPHVLLGTYEETGNEANFYGNWDMLGDDIPNPAFCCNSQGLAQLVVTHKGTKGPFVVTSFAPTGPSDGCMGDGYLPHLFDTSDDGVCDAVFMSAQNNSIGGNNTNYHVNIWVGGQYYIDGCGATTTFGTWSIGGRSGLVYGAIPPAPFVGPELRNSNTPLAGI